MSHDANADIVIGIQDWHERPEHVYLHALTLLAVRLEPLFSEELDAIAANTNNATRGGSSTCVGIATTNPVTYARMVSRMSSGAPGGHRDAAIPRTAMNTDIIRRFAAASSPKVALDFAKRLVKHFDGATALRCLPSAAQTAQEAEKHILPVVVNVNFAPAGLTLEHLIEDQTTQDLWAARRRVNGSGLGCHHNHTHFLSGPHASIVIYLDVRVAYTAFSSFCLLFYR